MYKGWDVHSYTGDLRQRFDEWCTRDEDANALLFSPLPRDRVRQIYLFFLDRHRPLYTVLEKMRARSRITAPQQTWYYADTDLRSLNIWALLDYAMRLTQEPEADEGTEALLVEMLIDTGNTCIQGDSHRIAMFAMALKDDIEMFRAEQQNSDDADEQQIII